MSSKKSEILGESFGAASHKLRKSIIFHLSKKAGMDICFRCGNPICHVDEMTIEHKKAWQSSEDPYFTFFDLDNIAFSHPSCNSSAAVRPNKKYNSLAENKADSFRRMYADPVRRDRWNSLRNERRRKK